MMGGFFVKRLTNGTITRPATMAKAPQLIGDWRIAGNALRKSMFAIISTEPKMKQTAQEAFVTFLE